MGQVAVTSAVLSFTSQFRLYARSRNVIHKKLNCVKTV